MEGSARTFLLFAAPSLVGEAVYGLPELHLSPSGDLRRPPMLRAALRRLVRMTSPRVPVLSYGEVGGSVVIETVGMVSLAHAVAA